MTTIFEADPQKWANETFQQNSLPDRRLSRRLLQYVAAQSVDPSESTSACTRGDLAEREGAYRLLENPRVSAKDIERGPFQATANRCQGRNRILIVQDTTFVALASKRLHEQMLDSGHQMGLSAHSCMAVDGETGEAIGLLAQHRWQRPPKITHRIKHDRKRPLAEKESFRWLETDERARLLLPPESSPITVCDREADFFEFLQDLRKNDRRFVIRAKDRLVQGSVRMLFDKVSAQPLAGVRTITIEQRGRETNFFASNRREGRPRRKAFLLVQACPAVIPVPTNRKIANAAPLAVNCVRVYEMEGDLEWFLLTSEPIDCEEAIEQIIKDYEHRWKIEEFHRWWKTGCRLEERPFQSLRIVENMMVILAPMAIRLMQLHHAANDENLADGPANILTEEEQECLLEFSKQTRRPIQKLTCRAAYEAIGKLGGFADTKKTGRIGCSTLWRGWMRFQDRFMGWKLARRTRPPQAGGKM